MKRKVIDFENDNWSIGQYLSEGTEATDGEAPGVAGREVAVMALEISGVNPDWSRGGAVRLAISMSHTLQVFNPPSAVPMTEEEEEGRAEKVREK